MDGCHCHGEGPTVEAAQDHLVEYRWDGQTRGVDGCDGTIVSEPSRSTLRTFYSLERLQWLGQIYFAPRARAAKSFSNSIRRRLALPERRTDRRAAVPSSLRVCGAGRRSDRISDCQRNARLCRPTLHASHNQDRTARTYRHAPCRFWVGRPGRQPDWDHHQKRHLGRPEATCQRCGAAGHRTTFAFLGRADFRLRLRSCIRSDFLPQKRRSKVPSGLPCTCT